MSMLMAQAVARSAVSLSDPAAGSSALLDAAMWLQDMMIGTVATSIAIIAVAAIGFRMLTGRINIRHGVAVTVGCFILFGAPMIASGLRMAVAGDDPKPVSVIAGAVPPGPRPPTDARPVGPQSYDPYPGAAAPTRPDD